MKKMFLFLTAISIIMVFSQVDTFADKIPAWVEAHNGKLIQPINTPGHPIADGYCECNSGSDCMCDLINIHLVLNNLGKPNIKPRPLNNNILLDADIYLEGNSLIILLNEIPRYKSPKLILKAVRKLHTDTCKKLGYKSISILAGDYVIKGKTLSLKVKLGAKILQSK